MPELMINGGDMGFFQTNLLVALSALLIDRFIGYPDIVYRAIRHPVVWIGALIRTCDNQLNNARLSPFAQRMLGVLTLILICAVVAMATIPLRVWITAFPGGLLVEAVLAASLLSQKSLLDHVGAVAAGLAKNLDAGRGAVRHIVGRDPELLDESGVARGAIESLAENASDGVIAPLFFLLVGGLPGIAIYKAVNTADSMIGYKSDRYRHFGLGAARFDDLLNFVPARMTGLLVIIARSLTGMAEANHALRIMRQDAGKHVSPNAGWPEAATAGALGIRLGGPRQYDGRAVDLPWLGDGRVALTASDIRNALCLTRTAFTLATLAIAAGAILLLLS